MSRKNIWIRDVEKMLQERAMSSTEISFALKDRFGYRYNPHARKITLVLKPRRVQGQSECAKLRYDDPFARRYKQRKHRICQRAFIFGER